MQGRMKISVAMWHKKEPLPASNVYGATKAY